MDNNYHADAMPKKQILSTQIDLKKFEKATEEEKPPAGRDEREHHLLPGRNAQAAEKPAGGDEPCHPHRGAHYHHRRPHDCALPV